MCLRMVPTHLQINNKHGLNKLHQQLFSFLVLLILVCISSVLGDGTQTGFCSYQYSNGGVVDLSSIGFDNGTARWTNLLDLGEPGSPFLYSYNPCYGFNQGPECQNVSACQQTVDASMRYPIGDADSADFSEEDDHLYINYNSYTDIYRYSRVELVCDPNNNSPDVTVLRESVPGVYEMILLSKCCCPDLCTGQTTTSISSTQYPSTTTTPPTAHTIATPPPKNPDELSAGSVLCIIFVCCVAAYIIFGALYMKLFVGASGKEIFPNYNFWNDFPNLVMDGFSFVASPCTGKSGKGVYEDL